MLLMGKSTISMAISNSYVKLPEGINTIHHNPIIHNNIPYKMPQTSRKRWDNMGVSGNGGTPIAGWFISWKMNLYPLVN